MYVLPGSRVCRPITTRIRCWDFVLWGVGIVNCAIVARRLVGLLGLGCLLAACQSQEYLQKSEEKYGVGDSWYGSDLRVYHEALLAPTSMRLHNPGYIVGVEELHPTDRSFVTDAGKRYVEHAVTHIIRYDGATNQGVAASSGCAIFSLLEPEGAEPDAAHGIFTHCRAAQGEPEAVRRYQARSHAPQVDAEPDDCARTEYGPLDAGKTITLPVAQGEAIRRFHQSLCYELGNGNYSHVFLMVMGWNTNQSLAFKNFNSIVNNIALAAQTQSPQAHFKPLIVGVTWPSELNIGPWSVLPQELVHLSSFFSKRQQAEDVGRYVLSDIILNVLDARRKAAELRNASHAVEPRVVMIGHSFGARALVNALVHPITGAASSLDDPQSRVREMFQSMASTDRLVLLQGAVEFGSLFAPDMQLAGTIGDGRPRVTMTASEHDSANNVAFWGYYTGTERAFREACENPLNKDIWQSAGYHLDQIGCAVLDGRSERYGFQLCRPAVDPADGTAAPAMLRSIDGRPVRYFDASRMINCDAPFTGGGAHSDIFRLEIAQFLWDEMQDDHGTIVASTP
jgi:hypothetical protein